MSRIEAITISAAEVNVRHPLETCGGGHRLLFATRSPATLRRTSGARAIGRAGSVTSGRLATDGMQSLFVERSAFLSKPYTAQQLTEAVAARSVH